MELTKDFIKGKLLSDDKWLTRAVIAIYNKQTNDEKMVVDTKHHNNIGFNGVDGRIGTSMGEFASKSGFLTPKQIKYIRPRMLKYSGQLLKIANGEL